MSRRYGSLQILAAATLWGTTGPVQVLARLPVAPAAVGGMRILAGGLVLLAWTLARHGPGPLATPDRRGPGPLATPGRRGPGPLATLARQRRHWRPLLAASCATGVFQASYFTSVSRTGAALATAIVFGVAPVATGLAARITGRSPLGWGWAAGTGCAVAGCVLLLLPGRAGRVDSMGVALALVAAGCYAVYTVSAKRLADDGTDMPAAVSVTLIAGGLLLTPWLVAAGPGLFSGRALLTAAWLGPVTTAVAYMLFVQGLRTVSAATAGTLSLAEPLVAALVGIGLLHEHLAAPAVIGCGLLAAGLACASLVPSAASAALADPHREGDRLQGLLHDTGQVISTHWLQYRGASRSCSLCSGREVTPTRAPAAPATAAPPAEAATSHRVTRGRSRHDDRLATTSSASDRAPAATQARADPACAAGPCSAASAPSPRARSRAPSARPNTRAATSSAAAPTHGRAGTDGQARAVTPSATRPAATAKAPRRSSDGTSVDVTCTLPSRPPSSAARLMDDPYVRLPVLAEVTVPVDVHRGQARGEDVVAGFREQHLRPGLPLTDGAGDVQGARDGRPDPGAQAGVHPDPGVER